MSYNFFEQNKMNILPSTCGFYTKSDNLYKGWKILSSKIEKKKLN